MAKSFKVILRKDVENLGRSGDVKSVSRGFARNYLVARGLALEATTSAVRWYEKGEERRKKLREKAAGQAKDAAGKLAGVALSFSRPVSEQGKLFGSVGKSDILKSLKAAGHEVDKNAVRLESALREPGDFEVEVRLSPEASAKIKVSIVPRA